MNKASTIAAILMLGTYGTLALAQPALKTDQDKTLYAIGTTIGTAIGKNVASLKLTPDELKIVEAGISDAVLGKKPQVDMATYGPRIQMFAKQRLTETAMAETKTSKAFLEKMGKKAHAETTASGLVYIPIKEGAGARPTADDTVRVNYVGKLPDGTVFDSSKEHGQAATFPLKGVIPCWTEGLQKMRVGGKATLVCPSDLAYGVQGQGPIPGGAALEFEVELLGIESASKN